MIRRAIVSAVALVALMQVSAPAQAADKGDLTLGADLMPIVIPFGDWADATGVGILGFAARVEYRVLDFLAVTNRLGFIAHIEKDNVKTNELPWLFGARYYTDFGLWGGFELGLVNVWAKAGGRSRSSAEFGMNLPVGYRWKDFDFGLSFFFPDVGDAAGMTLSVGYNFADFAVGPK